MPRLLTILAVILLLGPSGAAEDGPLPPSGLPPSGGGLPQESPGAPGSPTADLPPTELVPPGPGPAVAPPPAAPVRGEGTPQAASPPHGSNPPAPGSEIAPEELDAALGAEERAELRFLLHLGWRVLRVPGGDMLRVERGNPWAQPNLQAAQAAGDLRILLPEPATSEQLRQLASGLDGIADSIPSRAAWKFRLETAVRSATRKLAAAVDDGHYSFPEIFGIGLPFFTMKPPGFEWKRAGSVVMAQGSASAAVEAFYERQSVMECYAGQWMAIFATQYELYGAEWFDEVFRPEELVLGRPEDIKRHPIGAFSRHDVHHEWRGLVVPPEWAGQDPAFVLTRFGPRGFTGITGILLNQDPDVYSNENFMIVSISDRAVELIREAGGIHAVAIAAKEVWRQDDLASGWFKPARVKEPARAERERLLSGPLFSEIVVYCHPYGVVPLRVIVEKKLSENPSPIYLMLYMHGVEDALYQRYRHAWKRRNVPGYSG